MTKRIAVLVTGIIRENINDVLDNVRNIKNQLSSIGKVDVYFHTWEPQGKYIYTQEDINRLRQEVYFLMTSPCPEKFPAEYNIRTLEDPEKCSYNVLCMLYAIGQLCNCVTENYDYVCRLRNDLYIQDNFKIWMNLLDNGNADYIYPLPMWTFDDCANDHFGIANQDNFMKLWKRDWFCLRKDFKELNDCPEQMLTHKLKHYKMKVTYIIPNLYRYKGDDFIYNGQVQIEKLNGYMQNYMRKFLSMCQNIRMFNLKS